MEIVIKIHEKDYQAIKNGHIPFSVYDAIMKGTPLPEHHGDLIDRNDLLEYTDINECAYIPTINRYDIITTPTIIEADKENTDEEE